jgi:hypothetical protein
LMGSVSHRQIALVHSLSISDRRSQKVNPQPSCIHWHFSSTPKPRTFSTNSYLHQKKPFRPMPRSGNHFQIRNIFPLPNLVGGRRRQFALYCTL